MDPNSLYTKAFLGDADAIQELEKNEYQWTIVHYESWYGNVNPVRYLLASFPEKNYLVREDKFGRTPLHLAVERGNYLMVEALIDVARSLPSSSANIPAAFFTTFVRQVNKMNNTALHTAVEYGYWAIVQLLTRADEYDKHYPNSSGETPLYTAAKLGYDEIIRIICGNCATPSTDGPAGITALHAAVQRSSKGMTKMDTSVFVALINAVKRSIHPENDKLEGILDKTTQNNMTVLDLAVDENQVDVVKVILAEHPAYQPGRISSSYSQLEPLIDTAGKKGYNDMVKLLCDTSDVGRPNYRIGLTALITAIKRRDKDFVIRLVEEDRQLVTSYDDKWWTPLHHSADNEFDSILEFLVDTLYGITGNRNLSSNAVMTPLWLAAKRGHTSTVIRLIDLMPESIRFFGDSNGENLLHWAAAQHKTEMIQYILKNCPQDYIDKLLTQKNNTDGNTPLHVLIDAGCFVPELLKHRTFQEMVKNNELWTPADMLYKQVDIIADQVLIKAALDENYKANQGWKFWFRSIMGKSDTRDSLVARSESRSGSIVPPSKTKPKDEKFEKEKKLLIAKEGKRMKEELERYRLRTNTQIVVTALITTVTFTVGFTMPGGYHQSGEPDEGLVLLSKDKAFNIFMVSDALALALSITSLFIYFISSMYEDSAQVSKLDVASTVLNIVSVIAMMLTFVAGTYVVLPHSHGLAISVCIICSMFFLAIVILLAKMVHDRSEVRKLKV